MTRLPLRLWRVIVSEVYGTVTYNVTVRGRNHEDAEREALLSLGLPTQRAVTLKIREEKSEDEEQN